MGLIGRHLPRRDFALITGSLAGITLLAWVYLFYLAANMTMSADGMMKMGIPVWDTGYFLMMFLMWAIMMVGMMVPTVTPSVLIFASVRRKARLDSVRVPATALFVLGYIAVWSAFSLAATAAQLGLDRAALLSPMMVASSPWLGAGLLVGAGIYQFLPLKDKCLQQCRSPVEFISRSWRNGSFGAFRMGISNGAFCLGCCWVLMLLLFVGGVMNLAWIAIITIFVLLEKILPLGDAGGRIVGILMIIAGGYYMVFVR